MRLAAAAALFVSIVHGHGGSAVADDPTGEVSGSPYPSHGVPQFVVDHLDVLSFPSSIRPRRIEGKRLFKDYDVFPTKVTDSVAELEPSDGGWRFDIRILERGARGILVCLEDRARNGGSYHAQSALRLVSKDGMLVADEKTVKRKDCREFAE